MESIFLKICKNGSYEIIEWLENKYTDEFFKCINNMLGYTFIIVCSKGYEKIAKWMYKIYRRNEKKLINLYQFNMAFIEACASGFKKMAEWLLISNPMINIKETNNKAFLKSIENGNYDIVLWLLTIFDSIEISFNNFQSFKTACLNNHLDIAELLYKLKPIDVTEDNDNIFRTICKNNLLEVAIWFESLLPTRYKIFLDEYGDIVDFTIYRIFEPSDKFIKKDTASETCPICMVKQPNIMTDCKHMYCDECIRILYEKGRDECCLCRREIKEYDNIIGLNVDVIEI